LYLNGEPKVAGQILLNPADFNPALNYSGPIRSLTAVLMTSVFMIMRCPPLKSLR
jgi:hypothetical protein